MSYQRIWTFTFSSGTVTKTAIDCLLAIFELTTESADILKNEFLSLHDREGFELNNLVSISRDNPNVNKRLVKLIKEETQAKGVKLADLATVSCMLLTMLLKRV